MIPLTPWLEHLRLHLPIASAGEDPEGVHQVRVATRRLAIWLKLAGRKVLRADLRWLRQRAGTVRDLDVLLLRKYGRSPPEAWARWLTARRRVARRQLLAALDDQRLGALVEALSLLPPLQRSTAQASLRRIAARVLAVADELQAAPRDVERLHALRRAVRLLRYALEWLGEPTDNYRELQEVFGEVGDLSMSLRTLDASPAAGSLARERAAMLISLGKCRARSLRLWMAARPHVEALA